jgi:hypothetical protein
MGSSVKWNRKQLTSLPRNKTTITTATTTTTTTTKEEKK